MNWRYKGALQRAIGRAPGGDLLHYYVQRYAGGLRDLGGELTAKLEDWRLMVGHLGTAGISVAGTRFFEMGTGWYPTFPMCLYLGGAASVDTIDLTRHMRADLTLDAAEWLGWQTAAIAVATRQPAGEIERRHSRLLDALRTGASIEDASSGVIRYRAPGDASRTALPEHTLDVVFSNSVLEHVPGPVIAACFTEARRILRPGAVMFQSVNCGDHYAYTDKSIDQLNYLRFSDDEWRQWDNKFLYQNRLRAIDFTTMARAAGFTVELDTSRPHPTRLAQLEKTPVHPSFTAKYARDQLAITSIDFVARAPR